MQNVTADAKLSADMKAISVSRKSQGNNKSKKVDQESRSFTEILEQLGVITLPSAMGAGLKADQNDEIPAQEQGDCLSKPLAKAMKSLATGNDLKSLGAKVNGTVGKGAKAEKLHLHSLKEETSTLENYPKTEALMNKSKQSGKTTNPASVSVKDNMPGTAGNTKTDVGIVNSQAVSNTQADIDVSEATARRLTSKMAEAGASSTEKQNFPGSNTKSKAQQVSEPGQVQAPPKKTDTHNHPGAIEKSGSPIDLQTAKTPELVEKAVLPKSQLDSIVSNMIQQIKAGPSSLELSLKPEYLGKINIMVELNESMISIKVVAQSGEAAYLLNSNLSNIKENLEQQGVRIQQMEVNLANQEKQDNQKGGREQTKQSSQSHKHIPASYGVADNREHIYLLPNKLNVWA